jgi:hypothetical protein
MGMDALKGIVIALISSLLIAILFAYIFRIPIPMGGYIGPFGEFSSFNKDVLSVLNSVLVAWVFYGVFGGFIILPILGAISGIVIGRKYQNSKNKSKMVVLLVTLVSAIPVFLLSILDYIIGPW